VVVSVRHIEMVPDLIHYRDYYASLLRTHQGFIAPTQGKLLNYVQRVPLGVVAQITVSYAPDVNS
jgi:acyl-CoA reductase-like NAD-dependent aldehyde dehydrogenase